MKATGTLKPWAQTPFELLRHAEEHRRSGTDFDRRIALVSFDNSIEVSVITYLSLNPIQRGGREFERAAVENWMRNFHTKLAFLESYAKGLDVPIDVERTALVYYHRLRNDLYHAGNGMVPAKDHLLGIRRGAVWAFSLLFECDAEALLDAHLGAGEPPAAPSESTARTAVAISAATTFLQAFLSAKEVAEELLELRGKAADFTDLLATVRATGELSGLQADSASPQLFESLAKAEHVKDLILQGETPDSEAPLLDSLADALDTLAIRLKSTLRTYQQDIAMSAMHATLAAQTGNRRAGVVTQPTGSGLSGSLLAYLSLCTQHPQLKKLRFIVLTDRRVLVEQFADLYQNLLESDTQRKLVAPDGEAELAQVLDANSSDVVVTAVQQLDALAGPFLGDGVVIGYNLRLTAHPVTSRFPRGIYILFFSGALGSMKTREQVREIFGETIRNFAFQDAMREGLLVPVLVRDYAVDALSGNDPERGRKRRQHPEPTLELVARTAIRDETNPVSSFAGKAVILVPDLDSGARMIAAIERLRCEQPDEAANTAGVHAFMFGSTSKPETARLLHQFCHSASPDVLVTTPARLTGLDLPIVDRCYVTCAIPIAARVAVFSLVSRRQPDKTESYIHDFGENHWNNLVDEGLETIAPLDDSL